MKKIKYIYLILLMSLVQSCDWLDLAPTDIYSINNYWDTKDQVDRYIRGLHVRVRSRQEIFLKMGELRGGTMLGTGTSLFNQSMSDIQAINNNLSEANCVISGWGNLYMDILQINHAIESIPGTTFLTEAEKNYDMGMLHGLRAFYYFHLFRTYGGIPIVKRAEVMDGSFTPAELNLARSSEEETYAFILEDVKASDSYFAGDNYTINASDKSSYWGKAATKMLKAEVLLWGCKVKPIGGTRVYSQNVTGDLETAKTDLQDVINSGKYDFATMKFGELFDESKTKKDNKEMIFVIRFLLNEQENPFGSFVYPTNVNLTGFEDPNGVSYDSNPNPKKLGGTSSAYQYSPDFFKTFRDEDTRRAATFFDVYRTKDKAPAIMLFKFPGELEGTTRRFTNDWPVYRYADLQLMMAEILAMQGGDPATYINNIRKRAYDTAYETYKYPHGNETAEDAILEERTREFVAEGKVWYDLRRMKNGELAKQLQAVTGNLVEQHLLWPVDAGTLSKDPLVTQTPGY
ncbi:RagB/SusD family nutrient uptake outer membrane protein [Bacteroides ovatus]|uniref:Starch-binding associating with outer membrane n=1 Tax=Bacteroides ovatus TaxID=28116 RepID=A0A1G8FAT1_BACOV|nr:RagB/SusD family nutrient uptake outer membrane protein [Bacteroides ovatus]SDH79195.1 Starch-binding associating with outer membrane [Bacteroides ovatus]